MLKMNEVECEKALTTRTLACLKGSKKEKEYCPSTQL
jgi:hypothetical protein